VIDAIDIGLARRSDARAIAVLSREVVEYGLDWAWTPQRVRRAIADRATNVIVARDGGVLIGFALLQYRDASATLQVAGITAVHAEVRESNRAARAFYAKLGYVEGAVTRGYYQGRDNAVRLVRTVMPSQE
jgi:ribosomal-protein-alanine N-acetyltransferase